MVKVTKGMYYVVCVVTGQVVSGARCANDWSIQPTIPTAVNCHMMNTSLPGPCNLQCEQHSAIMFNYSITGPSSTSSGQRSCSGHVPSCQHCQQQSTVMFSSWSKLPTLSAAVNGRVQFMVQAANIVSSGQRLSSIHH